MIFGEKICRNNFITIDGYSSAKTIKGAIKDLGRFVSKININEGKTLISYTVDCLSPQNGQEYFLIVEEVSCASREDENGNMEYKDGNFYLCIGFSN
jgi:hypothetical protein